jgi:hypothetical protein
VRRGHGGAFFSNSTVLHTGFADPRTPADAPDRSSVEVRVLCLLPPSANM